MCLRLPPMCDKDRYLARDIVSLDYTDLVAVSVGEGNERHIIIYRQVYYILAQYGTHIIL